MLCSRFLRPPGAIRHGRLYTLSERYFERMRQAYEWSLKKTLDHGLATLSLSGLMLVATIYLFIIAPKGFLPSEDTNQIIGFTEANQGISFESMQKHQKEIAAIISENPNVEAIMSSDGPTGSSPASNTGRLNIRLKPRNQRDLSVDEIIQELRPKLSVVPGIQVFLQNPPPIRIGGRPTENQDQITLQGAASGALLPYAPRF